MRPEISRYIQGIISRNSWLLPLLLGAGLILSGITAAATFSSPVRDEIPPFAEEFDPFLAGTSSVDEIMFVLDTAYPGATPLQKLDAADALLRRRFFHSYSYFRFEQNWVAASLRPLWDDLASPVRPDEILAHRRAACSQQSMVFLEIARRLGFEYAAVSAPGHFLAGVKIDGTWWVYDANQEVRARRYPFSWLETADARLAAIYNPPMGTLLLKGANAGQISLTSINRFAAPQAAILHEVTFWFSRFGWLMVLGLWGLLRLSADRRRPLVQARVALA